MRWAAMGKRVARLRRGRPQYLCAEWAGVSENTWRHVERGRPCNLRTLAAMAEFLGVQPSELVRVAEEAEP